jgi:predicted membrane chloride channel (bestrophin family)
LRGPRKTLFTGPPRELPTHAFAFFTEIFKLRGTILLKIVPQIVLAAIAGLCANVAKIVYCGEGVTSNEECDVTFNLDGHLGVSVVLSFLLVFRADLAWKRYEQGKAALGAVHGGIRNLNVAAAVFLRRRARATRRKRKRKQTATTTTRTTTTTTTRSLLIARRFSGSPTCFTRSCGTPRAGSGTGTPTWGRSRTTSF